MTLVVTKMDRSINMSRDVIELAKNVKKEADAIEDLSNTLRRARQHSSGKKHGHGASSSVDRIGEGTKEGKQMIKHIKELEEKVIKFETIIEDLNHKLGKKDSKVSRLITQIKELEEAIENIQVRATRRNDNLLAENKTLNDQVMQLTHRLKDASTR